MSQQTCKSIMWLGRFRLSTAASGTSQNPTRWQAESFLLSLQWNAQTAHCLSNCVWKDDYRAGAIAQWKSLCLVGIKPGLCQKLLRSCSSPCWQMLYCAFFYPDSKNLWKGWQSQFHHCTINTKEAHTLGVLTVSLVIRFLSHRPQTSVGYERPVTASFHWSYREDYWITPLTPVEKIFIDNYVLS